jgi:hypothetical protein
VASSEAEAGVGELRYVWHIELQEIAATRPALRPTPDHWMIPLFGDSLAGGKCFVLEGRLISVARQGPCG